MAIADDHPFYRASLAKFLRAGGIDVVAEAPSGEAAVRAVEETDPSVVVMDLKMPGVSGLEATRRLSDEHPSTRVLVLTVSADEDDVVDAFLAGASGFALKEGPVEELVDTIRALAAGRTLLSPRIAEALLSRVRRAIDSGTGLAGVSLHARELEILDLLAKGCSVPDLAARTKIAESEIHDYVSTLLMKLRVDDAVQAALRALDSGDE